MSIKYYANKVQETTTSTGAGNLVLNGADLGFISFVVGIGANNTFNYYIFRQDTNFEWEIGVGYILSTGGVNQLVRERVVSSSNGNNLVGFSAGTKYVETILSEDRINTSFINLEQKSGNFTPPYIPATYVIDASVTGVQVNLPVVATEDDPIVLGFLLNKTIGNAYEQINAIQLIPSGSETIAGSTGIVDISILNDYLQIVSIPSQSGWLLLDPIQDSTNPYGNEGAVQFKSSGAFSGVNNLTWHSTNKLLIGDSGVATADIVIPASSGQTAIFNQNLFDNDFRIAGTGNSHLLFVDGGLNRVSINSSSATDVLFIKASSSTGSGLTISRSGIGPRILLSNTATSGLASNNVVGSIAFSAFNNSGNVVEYGNIKSVIENNAESSENSSIVLETVNNGSFEEIAVFSPSGITLGSNSQNLDGIVLGAGSDNEGNNIVIGYYNSAFGENCIALGDSHIISSGSYGGAIGSDHFVSGINLWVFGGSGLSVSGTGQTVLALDPNNYLEIKKSGDIRYNTYTNKDSAFTIDNSFILTSGVNQNIVFKFINSSGISKTGLLLASSLSNVSNSNENSSFLVKILSSGTQKDICSLTRDNIIIGDNSNSGTNIVFGLDNTVSNTNNLVIGRNISATGSSNVLIGNNIALLSSGTGITIIGRDNQCLSSGNLGVVILGNNNQSDEDYSIAIGVSNANSGLYTVSCGYQNGSHGDYSVSIGESNLVLSSYSVAVGRNNNVNATSIDGSVFAMGVGNSGNISNTGTIVGYLNTLTGSGGSILGTYNSASGTNNILLSNSGSITGITNILLGNTSIASGTNNILLTNSSKVVGLNNTVLSNSGSIYGTGNIIIANNINYTGSNTTLLSNTNVSLTGSSINISGTNTSIYGSLTGLLESSNNHKILVTPTSTNIYGQSGVAISGSGMGVSILTSQGNITISGYDTSASDIYLVTSTSAQPATRISITGATRRIVTDCHKLQLIAYHQTSPAQTGSADLLVQEGLDWAGLKITKDKVQLESTFSGNDIIIGSGAGSVSITGTQVRTSGSLVTLDVNSNNNLSINAAGIIGSGGTITFGSNNDNKLVIENTGITIAGDAISINNNSAGLYYNGAPTANGAGSFASIVMDTGNNNLLKIGYDKGVGSTSVGSASMTLYSYDKEKQFIDPSSYATVTITLDDSQMMEGRQFYIRNTSVTPSSYTLDIQDGVSASSLYILGGTSHSNLGAMFVFDGTNWKLMMAGE